MRLWHLGKCHLCVDEGVQVETKSHIYRCSTRYNWPPTWLIWSIWDHFVGQKKNGRVQNDSFHFSSLGEQNATKHELLDYNDVCILIFPHSKKQIICVYVNHRFCNLLEYVFHYKQQLLTFALSLWCFCLHHLQAQLFCPFQYTTYSEETSNSSTAIESTRYSYNVGIDCHQLLYIVLYINSNYNIITQSSTE